MASIGPKLPDMSGINVHSPLPFLRWDRIENYKGEEYVLSDGTIAPELIKTYMEALKESFPSASIKSLSNRYGLDRIGIRKKDVEEINRQKPSKKTKIEQQAL